MRFNERVATISRTRLIAAQPQAVWEILSDFGGISSWASNVDHSCVLEHGPEGTLIGTSRRVQIGRNTLVERITEFSPTQILGYDVEGLPRGLRRVHARWQLLEAGSNTQVTLASTIELGPNPLQEFAAKAICRAMARKSEVILAGLTQRMERCGD